MIKLFKLIFEVFCLVENLIKRLYRCVKQRLEIKGFRRCVYIVASVVLTATVLCTVFSYSGLTYALKVTVNGVDYGYVSTQEDADLAIDMVADKVVKDIKSTGDIETDYSYTITSSDTLLSSNELCDEIIDKDDSFVSVIAIYFNDKIFAKADSIESAEKYLNAIKGDNLFFNNIYVKESVVEKDVIKELYDIDDLDTVSCMTYIAYELKAKDTIKKVANNFDIPVELIYALNTESKFQQGDVLNIVIELPVLATVSVKEVSSVKRVSAAETGDKAGYVTEVYNCYYLNGSVYKTEQVSSAFSVKYPNKPSAKVVKSVGKYGFCWPVDKGYYQYVSSYWGDDRGHKGYDIAATTGTPILSVLDGVVESVNSSSSAYGQHFVIRHKNGLRTLYAHCSTLYVSAGETVSRGEVVALVGNTGRSTGSHLHFEVFKNGARVNPSTYIGK